MKKDKINLALLWSHYDGGVTSVNDLVLGLDKERFNAIFIYLTGYGVETNFIEEAGYDVFYLSNMERIRGFRLSILYRLIRILKERNIEILHCHAHKCSSYGANAATFTKTPVVLSHVHGLSRTRNFKRRLANFLLFRKFTRIIAVAKSVKEDVLRSNWSVSTEKISVLENSIDYKRFADVSTSKEDAKGMLGFSSDAFVFGTVGRLSRNKGQIYLIKAFVKAKQMIPSANLIFVGEGPLRQDLEKDAAKMGVFDSIHFLGRRDDIEKIYKAIDVFVLPSIGSEGMPRVILEAMAAGVPCVGTKIGGTPEVICNNDIGYVVESRDSEALAQAMTKLAKMTPKKQQKLIDNAKQRIYSHYSHDVVIRKLENIYETELTDYYESDKRQKSNV
ncbi:MAG: glycosyltransferase [Planctomycetes bacterium]|nr:glycosyltransferase [Planctomycetota bacterium]